MIFTGKILIGGTFSGRQNIRSSFVFVFHVTIVDMAVDLDLNKINVLIMKKAV